MGMVGTGSCYRNQSACKFVRMLVAGRLLERPGPTVHPMAWVDTRAAPKAAGLQRMLWPGRPRKGTVGRPRLQERQGTRDRYDTMPSVLLDAVRTGEGSVAISVTVLLTAMTPSSWWDRQLER